MVCTRITEWIEEKISRPVTEWVERREEKCKKRKWYDPRRWLCWIVTTLAKVIRWIVINVVKMVITIVCRLVARVIALISDVLRFFWYLGKALFTWDKCALQEALAELADLLIHALTILHVFVDPFVDAINRHRLRGYVRDQIESRFGGDAQLAEDLRRSFHVDHGVFGFRTTCGVYRMFVDSRTRTERFPDVPNLLGLHREGVIDLFQLTGLEPPCALTTGKGWYRPRYQTAKFPFASGGGIGDPVPPELTEDELREYIDSNGEKGPHFRIYAIHQHNLDTRINTTELTARRLGLILRCERREVEVLHERHIVYTTGVQPSFLIEELGRHDTNVDPDGAHFELCEPVAVAVFGFTDRKLRGWTTVVEATDCAAHDLPSNRTSGVSFIDDIPDEVRRYVLVHELGHYFGLCHVDGFSRIMVSGDGDQGELVTVGAIGGAFIHGGPRFTLDEGKQVWRYIFDHFPTSCLLGHEEPTDTPVPVIP